MLCRTSTGALGPPWHSLLHPLSPQDSSTIVGGALGQDRDHVPVVILVPGARRKIIVPPFRLGRLPKFCNLRSNIYFPRPASHWGPIWPTWDFFCYVLGSSWSSWMSLWAALGAISPRLEVLCCLLGACWSLSCPFGLLRAAVGTPIPPNPVPIAFWVPVGAFPAPLGSFGSPLEHQSRPIPSQSQTNLCTLPPLASLASVAPFGWGDLSLLLSMLPVLPSMRNGVVHRVSVEMPFKKTAENDIPESRKINENTAVQTKNPREIHC